MRKSRTVILVLMFTLFIMLFSSCTPKAKLFTLEVVSNPGNIGIVLLDGLEQKNYTPSDVRLTPFEVSLKPYESIIIQVVNDEPLESDEEIHIFDSWMDGSKENPRLVTVDQDRKLVANTRSKFKVSLTVNPKALVEISGSGWYEKGSSLTVTAPTVENYTFTGWKVNGESSTSNPLTVTVDRPTKIEAIYGEITNRTLTVGSDPAGLKVIIDSSEYTAPANIQAKDGTSHTMAFNTQERDASTFVPGIDTRYTFKSWSDSNTSNPRTILLDSDKSYTVQTETQYLVKTSTLPEEVASIDGAGWKVKDSLFSYKAPDSIGYEFSYWEVNGVRVDGRDIEVAHDSPKNIVAVYTLNGYSVSVNTEPTGLELKVNGVKKVAPASVVVKHGESVSVEIVTPQERDESTNVDGMDSRYSFVKWSDGNTSKVRTLTATGNVSLTAQMKSEYLVSVSSTVATISGSGWYEKGSSLTVTAPSVENYTFTGWKVNGESSTSNPLTVTVDRPTKITAEYNGIPSIVIPDQTVNTGTSIAIDLKKYASDREGDVLTFSKITGVGTVNGSQFSYSAADEGTYSTTIKVSDGKGGESTDTFNITVQKMNNAPSKPYDPSPANNGESVALSVVLSWFGSDPDGDPLKYDVYFGETSDPALVASGITTNTYSPDTLQNGKDYYWKVVAVDSKNVSTAGDIWKFRTIEAEIPPEDGLDMNGPVYRGNVLLVSNESENGAASDYTGTLNSEYLPSSSVLPKNLDIEAYALNMEIPLPDDVDISMKMRPELVEDRFELMNIGSTKIFYVQNFKTNKYYQITATLQYSGETNEIWVENTSLITVEKATQIGEEFDDVIYPLVSDYFYTPSDVNGDGKVAILCFDIQDDFSNTGAYVGGYFSSGDLFNISNSNKMEIFYIDTYPTMQYPASNPVDVSKAFSTLVHEFQHMVNFNRNYFVESGDPMSTWLNEGLSMAAEHIYKGTLNSRISYYNNANSIKNGQSLLYWNDNGDVLANYSLSYLFLQYVRTQGGGDPEIFKDILLNSKNNQQAIIDALSKRGLSIDFGDLMTSFRLALLLKDPSGLYGFNGDSDFDGINASYYIGGAKNIRGGSAFFKTISESFTDPENAGNTIQYVGITN